MDLERGKRAGSVLLCDFGGGGGGHELAWNGGVGVIISIMYVLGTCERRFSASVCVIYWMISMLWVDVRSYNLNLI